MTTLHRSLSRPVPQSEPLTPGQVRNSQGGYVFKISQVEALRRFLILGTEGGTFHKTEHEMTKAGIDLVRTCASTMDPQDYITEFVAAANVAPKRSYALFAYAVGVSTDNTKFQTAHQVAPLDVIKTGTDFFEFVSYVEQLRGWGALAKRVVNRVLLETPLDTLGLWAVKYRDRHGWTWRDVLRIAHPKLRDPDYRRNLLFQWMLGKDVTTGILVVDGSQVVREMSNPKAIVHAIQTYGLPWEALADEQRTNDVWKACLPFIGNMAVLRNTAMFTRRGMDKDLAFVKTVEDRIGRASNLHPITVLNALKTYASGGMYGRSTAKPYAANNRWAGAMERSLNESFTRGVQPTGKSTYIAIDVSPSMGTPVAGSAVLSCRDVATAIALACAKNEPNYMIRAFASGGMLAVDLNEHSTFSGALGESMRLAHSWSGTDCSLPMLHATQENLEIDTFIVITDNETAHGGVHPAAALQEYRKRSGRKAKLAVVALTATNFSIADPADAGMMDFVGFSSDMPRALEIFSKM